MLCSNQRDNSAVRDDRGRLENSLDRMSSIKLCAYSLFTASPSVNWRLTVKAQIGSREFTPGIFERLYPGDGMAWWRGVLKSR